MHGSYRESLSGQEGANHLIVDGVNAKAVDEAAETSCHGVFMSSRVSKGERLHTSVTERG